MIKWRNSCFLKPLINIHINIYVHIYAYIYICILSVLFFSVKCAPFLDFLYEVRFFKQCLLVFNHLGYRSVVEHVYEVLGSIPSAKKKLWVISLEGFPNRFLLSHSTFLDIKILTQPKIISTHCSVYRWWLICPWQSSAFLSPRFRNEAYCYETWVFEIRMHVRWLKTPLWPPFSIPISLSLNTIKLSSPARETVFSIILCILSICLALSFWKKRITRALLAVELFT